jgi:serine protease Do
MQARQFRLTGAALAVIAALGGAYSLGQTQPIGSAHAATQETSATREASAAPVALPNMGDIVARNAAAVVNISVSGNRKTSAADPRTPRSDPGDPMLEFFRRFGGGHPGGEIPRQGMGSGFIVATDGTILTNAHVVEGAEEVTVKLTDKREFKARVLGLDKASDVAVLKIDANGLPAVRIGKASSTRVGDWVLAIGSPFGFESSASAGIVSAKSRSLPDGSYVPFIQTDVAVNPGNSGGPLFNMAGEVIGINSQIYSRSGGYQGLSFAIPIELATHIQRQIVATGKAERGRLGVTIQEVNQTLADSFGLKKPGGALVSAVEKNSPAARAGIEPGDVILAANGEAVINSGDLPAIIAAKAPGETVTLQVWRNGSSRDIAAKVGAFAEPKLAASEPGEAPKGRLGVAVRPLSPEEQRKAEIKGGVLVEQVGGAAARAGIKAGDIIVSVNGQPIAGVDELRSLIAKAGKKIAVLVERDEARIFVPVDLG